MSFLTSDFAIAMTICRVSVVSMGLFGNLISFIVFSRNIFRCNSISTYCRALAIFECLIIIQLIADIYSFINPIGFPNLSDASCKIFYYLSLLYTSIPGWILVAFSVDKMFIIRTSPLKILKSKLFQWSVVFAIVLFNMIFFVELLISLKLEPLFFIPDVSFCNFAFLSYFNALIYANIVYSSIIPFVIMISSSIVTIRMLMKSRRSLERMGTQDNQRRMRDVRYAVSSMAFNVLFIAFKIPFIISPLLPFDEFTTYYVDVSFLLFVFNCSSTFFIHLATNSIFRRELFACFTEISRFWTNILHLFQDAILK